MLVSATSSLARGRRRNSHLLLSQEAQEQHIEDQHANDYYWREISPLRYLYVTMNGFSISLPTTIINDNFTSLCTSLEERQSEIDSSSSSNPRKKRRKVKQGYRATTTTTTTQSCIHRKGNMEGYNHTTNTNNVIVDEYFVPDGVLEQFILSYLPVEDLCAACLVCRRWYEAGRNDDLWRDACIRLWSNDHKVGMPVVRRGGQIALFWRSLWSDSVIMEKLSVRDIISYFAERPSSLQTLRKTLSTVLETQDIKKAVSQFMPTTLGDDDPSYRFRHKWFGSYASSVIDSKRTYLTMDELCTRNGFDMHFKIYYDQDDRHDEQLNQNTNNSLISPRPFRNSSTRDFQPHNHERNTTTTTTTTTTNNNNSKKRKNWKLHYHSTYYFYENYELRQDPFHVATQHQTQNNPPRNTQNPNYEHRSWKWEWIDIGKVLRVGPYPLTVSRLDNWGWKLENRNVLFFYRGN